MNQDRITWALIPLVAFVLLLGVTAATAPDPYTSDKNAPETVTVSTMGDAYNGRVVRLRNGSQTYRSPTAVSYNGVQRVGDNRYLESYQVRTRDCGRYDPPCGRTGVRIRNWTTGETLWNWSMPTQTLLNSEIHDAELHDGRVALVDMDRERLLVLNRSTKQPVWMWNASTHYTAPANPAERDWLHINDVDRIGPERYLLSIRNANQLLIVKRDQGVVEVINKDRTSDNDENCRGPRNNQLVGETISCGDPAVLNHQHNPQWLGNGRVLVADSENDRIVELQRTPSGSWTVDWAHYRAAGVALTWPRDADRLPDGRTLITDTRNQRVVLLAQNGSVLWAGKTPPQPYDADIRNEYPSGSAAVADSQAPPIEQPIESISLAYGALHHLLTLPSWITEWHLGAGLAAVGSSMLAALFWPKVAPKLSESG